MQILLLAIYMEVQQWELLNNKSSSAFWCMPGMVESGQQSFGGITVIT